MQMRGRARVMHIPDFTVFRYSTVQCSLLNHAISLLISLLNEQLRTQPLSTAVCTAVICTHAIIVHVYRFRKDQGPCQGRGADGWLGVTTART